MCKNCHTCGTRLRIVLDGEEWCSICQEYRRYQSHGWGRGGEKSDCPAEAKNRLTSTKRL